MLQTTIAKIHEKLTATDTALMRPMGLIFICTGQKGGPGKSTAGDVLIDAYREAGQPMHINNVDKQRHQRRR